MKVEVNTMKKLFLILCLGFVVLLTGCSSGVLEYQIELGYNINDIDCQTIVFHMYQANQKNHHWHKLTTIEYKPQKNEHFDVDYDIMDDEVIFYVREKDMIEKKNSVIYDFKDIDSYRHQLSGAKDFDFGYKLYEIKNTDEEQFFRLYAFGKQGTTYYEHINLDQPYDEENLNIDNILITITFNQ